METGLYSYRDYSQELQHIYITHNDDKYVHQIPGSLYAWLKHNSISHMVNALEKTKLSIHLPYLTKVNESEFKKILPSFLAEIQVTEEDALDLIPLYNFLYRFETWYPRLSPEERFKTLVPQFKHSISHPNMTKAIRFLHDKYVTNDNKFRLYLHCGIQAYLLKTKERNN